MKQMTSSESLSMKIESILVTACSLVELYVGFEGNLFANSTVNT
jgi:hypothetical protein